MEEACEFGVCEEGLVLALGNRVGCGTLGWRMKDDERFILAGDLFDVRDFWVLSFNLIVS